MRAIVVGAGKSGTTGLYDAITQGIRAEFGRRPKGLFEPRELALLTSFEGPVAVAKVLLERYVGFEKGLFLDSFDKRVFIVRDPRDTIVSRLMWTVGTRLDQVPEAEGNRLRELLREKQRDPSSISVHSLCEAASILIPSLPESSRKLAYLPCDHLAQMQEDGFYILRYEDFVDGKLAGLVAYLGIPLLDPNDVHEAKHAHVKRSARHGEWKNWFLEDDCKFFIDAKKLSMLGYKIEPINEIQQISIDDSSGYIDRLKSARPKFRSFAKT